MAQWGVSYPKSGRTWLRALVGRVLCGRAGLAAAHLLDTRRLTAALGLPVMVWHHGGGSMKDPCPPPEGLEFDRARFGGTAVIFMMRDPRDTLVSAYFQASRRIRVFDGDVAAFVRSHQRGILKWVAYHNLWHAHRGQLRSFHLVRYESLHADPAGTLRGVLGVLGLADVTDAELDEAVEFARFDNMKRLESAEGVRASALRPRDRQDPESFKVRKGRVGGYREYLDEADVAHIEEVLGRVPCPLYDEYYR